MKVEAFPAAGTKVQATDFVVTIGGQAGNASVAISRLGGDARYAGALGSKDDAIANWIVGKLTAEHVDCTHGRRIEGAMSSVSLIMLDATGEKMIATRRGEGLLSAVPVDAEKAVDNVDAVLLDNRYPNFMMPIVQAATKRGVPRVLDLDRPAAIDDPLLNGSTHVVSSAEAMRGTTGEQNFGAALKKLGQTYKGFLAVTVGPEGVYWLDNGDVRHMDAFKVKSVDTLGAGDTFHGAFTLRLVETGDVAEAMRFGAAAAAIKCTRFGGLMGAPTRSELETFLKERGFTVTSP
ncbi:PfkB family carbohydrate kinase [Microbacteriaceae bacterium K1510]|nr:PfkB family carbohydrate kinase [Microbacteriaceae bacterium K1510]